MVSKSQLLTDDKNKNGHTAIETAAGLNRRQFLRRVGLSAGAGLLITQNMTQSLASDVIDKNNSTQLTKDDLPTSLLAERSSSQTPPTQTSCITPTIETRLFDSSKSVVAAGAISQH